MNDSSLRPSRPHRFARIASHRLCLSVALLSLLGAAATLAAQQPRADASQPWLDASRKPAERAHLAVQAMTLDEKIQLVHGDGWGVLRSGARVAPGHNGGAGFVLGIPRLHIPDLNLADSAVGARMAARESRYATLLPSTLALAATWDTAAGFLYGDVIGRELRDQGYNMSIGGGVNLMREPRNGRNFEYLGEDPLLGGVEGGNLMRGVQSNHIIGDMKHFAFNDQETDRTTLSVELNHRAMHETDLLAFEIANRIGQPLAVMCSYNKIEGTYACENPYTLLTVLRHEFGFKGFVVSDWEGTHSTAPAALAGLDMEQPGIRFFGDTLKQAIQANQVPIERLNEMVEDILYSVFASGAFDDPPVRRVVDPFRGRKDAAHIAEEGSVLLSNNGVLPLSRSTHGLIALIGSHADVGVLSGGGSAQVDAPGGNAINPKEGAAVWGKPVYFPSAPLEFIRDEAPGATVQFDPGDDPVKAAALAAKADIAIVFLNQWMSEGQDSPTLSLPDHQDALVDAIASANRKTIVVLETGGPVSMPWAGRTAAILETWYPGIGGGEAIAHLLFGDVNPSGKLPATFARQDSDLPYPQVPGLVSGMGNNGDNAGARQQRNITVDYNIQGVKVGYKWFQAEHKTPLFAFGHGLSYTTFRYSDLKVAPDGSSVSLKLENSGDRAGDEITQLYATLPEASGEPFRRLVGFSRVHLAPHQVTTLTINTEPHTMAVFDTTTSTWKRLPGSYLFEAGTASDDLPLHATATLR